MIEGAYIDRASGGVVFPSSEKEKARRAAAKKSSQKLEALEKQVQLLTSQCQKLERTVKQILIAVSSTLDPEVLQQILGGD